MMTTTHDPRGGGRPRLMLALGGTAEARGGQQEFPLFPGVTTIGSAADADVYLEGIERLHAEVRRDAADEYVYCDLGSPEGSRVDGQPAGERSLHSGDRIEIGHWTLSYYRDEFADHGRPNGGRQGGDPFRAPLPQPRPRGTSAAGGSEPTVTDPGEYY